MTQALGNTAGGTPFATGVDAFVYPQFISWRRAPTSRDVYNPGTRIVNTAESPVVIYETTGAGVWYSNVGGGEILTSLTVTGPTTLTGTTNINTTGSAVTTIGTGGTGPVNIGNATGNTVVTGTLTTSAGITATTGNIATSSGNVSASGTVTGGTGLSVTTGNLTLSGVSSKIAINATAPSTASVGVSSAMITGAVTITSSAVTTSSIIVYSRKTLGTAMGNVSITAQSTGSFVLTSSEGTETSTFNYLIIN